mgnify:CR=1 FL=1
MRDTKHKNTHGFSLSVSYTKTEDTTDKQAINYFKTIQASLTDLPALVTQHNYSLIQWAAAAGNQAPYNRKRDGDAFESASGVMIDVDENLSMDAAETRLQRQNYNYVLVTSKSHTNAHPKFHILVPFRTALTSRDEYVRVARTVIEQMFPESDQQVKDAARFFYGTPEDKCTVRTYRAGTWLDPYDMLRDQWVPTADISIHTATNQQVPLGQIRTKTPCYCPFPGHEDHHPSAVVFPLEAGLHTIYCSACDHTWVERKDQAYWDSQNAHYYHIGNHVYDVGLLEDTFFMEQLDDTKYYRKVGAKTRDDKESAMDHLVANHDVRHLQRVETIGDITAQESYYIVDQKSGIIEVHIAPIPVDHQENAFIEDYLDATFGPYTAFIKQYLAVYTYTNFRRLPYLILYGDRGTGKTLFAELVGAIYEPLLFYWDGERSNFSYEAENKLVIVEENIIEKKDQYQTLKKYGGDRQLQVHKKYQDPYHVQNNLNVILLSNEEIPLYVERRELPTDAKNNQFFVYRMPALPGPIDPQMQEKLRARLGHYIRTELKRVFDGLDLTQSRYSIEVPITPDEQALFENNKTNLFADAEKVLERLIEQFAADHHPDTPEQALLQAGWMPDKVVDQFNTTKTPTNMIIKELKREGIIRSAEPERKYKKIKGREYRRPAYQLSDAVTELFTRQPDNTPLGDLPLFRGWED